MKSLLPSLAVILTVISSCRPFRQQDPDNRALTFDTITCIRTTPVKDQGLWPVGSIYAYLSWMESCRINEGDSLELSPVYLVRYLCEKETAVNNRPVFHLTPSEAALLMKTHGITLYNYYRKHLNIQPEWFTRNQQVLKHNPEKLSIALDTAFGHIPTHIMLYGVSYTPQEMMQSVWTELSCTSFNDSTQKTPEDKKPLISRMKDNLLHGESSIWYGDTLQAGYSFPDGVAIVTSRDIPTDHNTPNHRFHAMHIIGIARLSPHSCLPAYDTSTTYFIAKDSHGTGNLRNGVVFLSEEYVCHHTVAIFHKAEHN